MRGFDDGEMVSVECGDEFCCGLDMKVMREVLWDVAGEMQ